MGLALGAVLYTLGFALLARVLMRAMLRTRVLPHRLYAASYGVAMVFSLPIAAYGLADGGPPQWGLALGAYVAPALVGCYAAYFARSERS